MVVLYYINYYEVLGVCTYMEYVGSKPTSTVSLYHIAR